VRQRACTEVETDAMLADLHNAQDSEEGELGALRFLLNRMATAQLRWPLKQMRRNFFMKHAEAYENKERRRAAEKGGKKLAQRRTSLDQKKSADAAKTARPAVEVQIDESRQGEEWEGPNNALRRIREKVANQRYEIAEQRRKTREAQARGEFDFDGLRKGAADAVAQKTKRRLAKMFQDAMYISSLGATSNFASIVPRFVRDAMTTNIMHELDKPEHEEIGPGYYPWSESLEKFHYLPGHHLSQVKRFQMDANSAEKKTELQLPGTEHIGPGKYDIWKTPRAKGPNPMKRTAPRSYLEDPATVFTEDQKNPLVCPGEHYVSQYHMFTNEDGTGKISDGTAAAFTQDERFQVPPAERERLHRCATQLDLEGLKPAYDKMTWDKSVPLYTGHRLSYHPGSGPAGWTLPLDDEERRQAHYDRANHFLKKRSRSVQSGKSMSKAATGGARCCSSTGLGPPPPEELSHQSKLHGRNKHDSVKTFKQWSPATSWSQSRSAKLKEKLQQEGVLRADTASPKSPSAPLSSIAPTSVAPTSIAPTLSPSPGHAQQGSAPSSPFPRCATVKFRRRIDTPLLEPAVSDGFVGNQTDITIEYNTKAHGPDKHMNAYQTIVERTPKTNLLFTHQPAILTNAGHGGKLGPGAYLGPAQFGAEIPVHLRAKRKLHKEMRNEFKGGCPKFKAARDREAQDLIMGKGGKVLSNMQALFS